MAKNKIKFYNEKCFAKSHAHEYGHRHGAKQEMQGMKAETTSIYDWAKAFLRSLMDGSARNEWSGTSTLHQSIYNVSKSKPYKGTGCLGPGVWYSG